MSPKMSFFLHIYPNKNNKINNGAFSLMELLIAVSIFSVISIAIYSTFNSGAAVLRRVKNIDLAQQKIILKQERFTRELRTQPRYNKQLFSGNKTKISFPGSLDYLPCRITYYFDPSSLCLMRVADKLSQIIGSDGKIDEGFKSDPAIFLPKIKEVQFSYLSFDAKTNEYSWTEEWLQASLPVAVKFTIIKENQEYVSTIFLPR